MVVMLAYDDVMYNDMNLLSSEEYKMFYVKGCVLIKKYCQGVSQVPPAMKKKKTIALFSLNVVIKFFIESIIQILIEPIFIRHCPES